MKLSILSGLAALALACAANDGGLPWEVRAGSWRTDAAWYDGKAEVAVYDATRTIYGVERRYVATAYTNKQRMDPATTVKASGDGGVEVFKQHWSERVPTENYDYDFSTAVFVRTADLGAFKLTASTQEDCGASFKQAWREGDDLAWLSSVYFPGAGLQRGTLPGGVRFEDELSLLLRDHFFGGGGDVEFDLVPSQKDTHAVPFEPVRATVRHAGREAVDVPLGRVEAERLDLVVDGEVRARYWFATDGSAPMLHALVRYEGPGGVTYRLRAFERRAYWERN